MGVLITSDCYIRVGSLFDQLMSTVINCDVVMAEVGNYNACQFTNEVNYSRLVSYRKTCLNGNALPD